MIDRTLAEEQVVAAALSDALDRTAYMRDGVIDGAALDLLAAVAIRMVRGLPVRVGDDASARREEAPFPITAEQANEACGLIERYAPAGEAVTNVQCALSDLAQWIGRTDDEEESVTGEATDTGPLRSQLSEAG